MNYCRYYELPNEERWWCNTHKREATHLCFHHGMMRVDVHCSPNLGGIMIACQCVPMDRPEEIRK